VASGPYMSLRSGCVVVGSTYVFRLHVSRNDGVGGLAQVGVIQAGTPVYVFQGGECATADDLD
jgi:hypothetical protein